MISLSLSLSSQLHFVTCPTILMIDENLNLLQASKCCGDKAVVVAVYAEKPRGKGGDGRHRHDLHHHHHHHHYHNFHQNQNGSRIDGKKARGYNRRAELLDYARHLRSPAQSNASLSSHPSSHNKQISTVEVIIFFFIKMVEKDDIFCVK